MKRILLTCGVASSALYVLINIFVPLGFEGYNYSTHTVSELSAISAPTRGLWVILASVYILLFAAFSAGVWRMSHENRLLRIIARLMFVYSVVNFYWPPMHLRGNEPTLTDTLHIVWAGITVLLMTLIMGFGAAAFGKRFRWYTIISMLMYIVFGVLTGLQAPNIPVDGPTPLIGIWERVNILIFMAWIVVFAVILLKEEVAAKGKDNSHTWGIPSAN